MAEFVEKRCEDMIPELEQMERIKLFDINEIRSIAKKLKEFEYKIQRHVKCKEDYLRYIQYEMDLLKLIKQRRDKYAITHKKSDIDNAIKNKVNLLYKEAISKFQEDVRFWIAYLKFCKHMRFQNSGKKTIVKMLQVHQDKPKCWHIAARWEIEENKKIDTARQLILRGLHFHPNSQILLIDIFRLELDETLKNTENNENEMQSSPSKKDDDDMPVPLKKDDDDMPVPLKKDDDDMPVPLKKAYVIYKAAKESVEDIKFIVELLNIAKEYKAEQLEKKIVSDMIQQYAHEPLMWDTMARRELEGLVQPFVFDESIMEIDSSEQSTLRDRIIFCNKVYQTAVKKIKTEEMWSFYIECLLEINQDTENLPNLKKKLLQNALTQGHQAKKLKEKYYLHWIDMLSNDIKDENAPKKLEEILSSATENIPDCVSLWHIRLKHLFITKQEEEADSVFAKAIQILGEKSLSLWRMKLLHAQVTNPNKIEEIFQAAVQEPLEISKDMKPSYIEWVVLTKSIQAARKIYESLCLQPPMCLELHQKMADLELMQPEIVLKHARRPYEMATLQFGKTNPKIWIDYIIFEMKHGEAKKVGKIHRRAVKTLDAALTDTFITEYALIKANPDSIKLVS
ncbi:PREDICTED: U3 small nucleolar RNA-associated protein 6 homolog [Polistes dominula]|uniref:U3 small nucleolar RNA-associated protein 6 homolog n=1 Tax=Polistes dominula TaxID=743375 RepID=A0ABM1IC57_POLDO|nr:PREDICTED: U3 small nucleolar RNA-associated protein 6 homolog [Polistes dominula]